MNFILFYHSFTSCWNHGNAHFLRGIARELIRLGHAVTVYEPTNGWSISNARRDGGRTPLREAAALVPGVTLRRYRPETLDLEDALDGADVVIAHEWNEPALIAALARARLRGGRFTLLFHDTHHRAVTAPQEIARFALDGFDGVLAFGEVLRQVYLARGVRNVFTWHEAADTALFHPLPDTVKEVDLIWIGNWGDDERAEELAEFLLCPAARLGLRTRIHGVRYPDAARAGLAAQGIAYGGWLPNHRVPAAFARARLTVHVPRRPYATALAGIPTIRMFEALACGIPLISAPWRDAEHLFPAGSYLAVRDGPEMTAAIARVLRDGALAASLAANGLAAIRARHTCAHRAGELIAIVDELSGSVTADGARWRPALQAAGPA